MSDGIEAQPVAKRDVQTTARSSFLPSHHLRTIQAAIRIRVAAKFK